MKYSAVFFFFLFSINSNCQTIDSVSVVIGNPHKIYISGVKPQIELAYIQTASANDARNSSYLRLYFKGCPTPPGVFSPYDTVLDHYEGYPFHLIVMTFLDTNAHCNFPQQPMFIDSAHLPPGQFIATEEFALTQSNTHIYPNPTREHLWLEYPQELAIDKIEIVGLMGRKWGKLDPQRREWDIAHLPTGSYTLVITLGHRQVTKKLMKW